MEKALLGLRKYQESARRAPLKQKPAIHTVHGASLRDYGGSGPPVVFVPSLINPPNVLDLSVDRSLLRWLVAEGHRPLLVDWSADVDSRRHLSVAGHVEHIVAPMLRALGGSAALVGYCLGGTMALAAASITPVRSVATIATPWHFAHYPEEARTLLESLWTQGRPTAERLGLFPMELLQSAFWSLDPARTVSKFERFAQLDGGSVEAEAFVLLEDWANDGPPIGGAAARELFEDLFAADLSGRGAWRIGDAPVIPADLPMPLLNIVSTVDRIVPAASATDAGERIEIDKGHVGMVVGGSARTSLWEPLRDWLFRF
ncbi:alpha/beta fold hydrolase [Allosphingosinicella deserti]|nr:alpha/beta fold hydrolase [Sphingomonas deserti]